MTLLPGTRRRPATRPPRTARRFGYTVAAAVNIVLLVLVHVSPGWRAIGFLTADTPAILPLVTASLAAGVAAQVLYLITDPPRLVALGGIVTTAIGLAALARIWLVFPFDLGRSGIDWVLVARTVLAVGIAGSVIGVLAQAVALVRPAGGTPD